jgi:hypothetical protein
MTYGDSKKLAVEIKSHFGANIAVRAKRSCNMRCDPCGKEPTRREKMIEKGLILTGEDAKLLSRTLSEIKTRAYEEFETSLDDTQALDTFVSCYRDAAKAGSEIKASHTDINPIRKHLVLGTVIGRHGGL